MSTSPKMTEMGRKWSAMARNDLPKKPQKWVKSRRNDRKWDENGPKMAGIDRKRADNVQKWSTMTEMCRKCTKIRQNARKRAANVLKVCRTWPKTIETGHKSPKWAKWTKMTENGRKWPKMGSKWPKNGRKWPKMAENGQQWPKMAILG